MTFKDINLTDLNEQDIDFYNLEYWFEFPGDWWWHWNDLENRVTGQDFKEMVDYGYPLFIAMAKLDLMY